MQNYPRNNPPPIAVILCGPGEYAYVVKADIKVNGYSYDVSLERTPQQQTAPKEYPRHNSGLGSTYTLNGTTMHPRSSQDHSFNYTRFHERQRSPGAFNSDSSRLSASMFNPTTNKLGDYPVSSTPTKQQPASLFRDNCDMM